MRPEEIAVVGDIGSDVEAARAAGAWGILVPTPATRADEVAAAESEGVAVVPDLGAAVDLVLRTARGPARGPDSGTARNSAHGSGRGSARNSAHDPGPGSARDSGPGSATAAGRPADGAVVRGAS